MAKGGGGKVRAANRGEQFHVGEVRQREVSRAVKAVGGKDSEAFRAAKNFGPLYRESVKAGNNLAEYQGRYPSGPLKGRQARAAMEQVAAASRKAGIDPRKLLNASMRGMLSPAGLAEGFASKAANDEQIRRLKKDVAREGDKKAPVRRGRTAS